MKIAMLFMAVALATAPQGQAPTRDAVTPTVGTAVVAGVVMDDDDPSQPVRRAIVVLAGDGLRPSRGAITDDDGRFSFPDLPAGRFTITVSRASFITSMYGAKRAGRPGTSIAVADGARLADLEVRLWRGAAVEGTLRDETGEPVAGVEVRAIPARARGQLPSLTNNGARTDRAGRFRIFGLEPGAYVVAALPGATGSTEYFALTDAQTDAALDALRRQTNPTLAGATPVASEPTPAQGSFGYAPIYFPGTSSIAQAVPLTLAAGSERVGLDFALQRVQTSVVSGRVIRSDGVTTAGSSVQLTALVPEGPFSGSDRLVQNARAAPDGSFRIAQVTPGTYQLVARAPVDPKAPGVRPAYVEAPTTPQLYAVTTVTVGGGDVPGIVLDGRPGIPVRGRFVFASDTLAPPADLTGFGAMLIPETDLAGNSGGGFSAETLQMPARAPSRPDGAFEFGGVAPGRYQLLIGGPPAEERWQLRSAMVGGRDVLDGLIEIPAGGGPIDLVVTYDDRPTHLEGRLETAAGEPVSDVFILAFAADRSQWGPYSRRVKAVRPDVNGAFAIDGLPPGAYLLAAVVDADPEDWRDSAFLDQVVPAAVNVTLVGGRPVVQNLRIGR